MKYDNWIMQAVRQNLGLESDDTSMDKEIFSMPQSEVLERFFTWNGVCGYGDTIINVVEEIFKITLEDEEQ